MKDLKNSIEILAKDINHKETVSFNFPKYEKIGTPYDVWLNSFNEVEKCLQKITETNPWMEEFPLAYLRREEVDGSGRIIRYHLDILGKSILIKFALSLLDPFVQAYVKVNTICSQKGGGIDKEVFTLPIDSAYINQPDKINELIINFLKEKGVDVTEKDFKLVKMDNLDTKTSKDLLPYPEVDDSPDTDNLGKLFNISEDEWN